MRMFGKTKVKYHCDYCLRDEISKMKSNTIIKRSQENEILQQEYSSLKGGAVSA